ncbi:hypothetical protein GJ700_17715 [Duganella sp. FT92W]|uniref:Uncharacterized protein n=1 Tax=Pseudoduganella rivuli TaxID=2666085 RepID=A0A7X2IQ77_9BURK|nr:hypothetical protein [Pseudoduganella rivuli]MRV73553.1 hypothetical protein [Pseudoduganella rivuli]
MGKKYVDAAKKIKTELSRYSKNSILWLSLQALEGSGTDPINRAKAMPNILFLLVKWSMQTHGALGRDITKKEFNAIANDIYQLQPLAAVLDDTNPFTLKIRSLLMQQVACQTDDVSDMLALARQRMWFCDDSTGYYREKFLLAAGISLDNFFAIAFYFVSLAFGEKPGQLCKVSQANVLIQLTPSISVDDLASFLKLTATRSSKLPEFFSTFREDECPTWEYFSETPFVTKPLILEGKNVIVSNRKVLLRSMGSFVSNFLKTAFREDFKKKFGETMERYVETLLIRNQVNHINEDKIAVIYTREKKKGKLVDFLIEDAGRIFLDAKAIEPNDYTSTCVDPTALRERLTSSYIKAIWQGQECSHNLSGLADFPKKSTFMLVVVHQDHFISTGQKVETELFPELTKEIVAKYGALHIPLQHIYYVTIHDLECLLAFCRVNGKDISEFLTDSARLDADALTAKMVFHMHLPKPDTGHYDDSLADLSEIYLDQLSSVIQANAKYWNGKVGEYYAIWNHFSQLI